MTSTVFLTVLSWLKVPLTGSPSSQLAFHHAAVIALVGTAAQAEWYPHQVKAAILALDADEGGKEATSRLECRLKQAA